MESSSPNYKTHLEAFQDSQDPYDMWQIRQKIERQNADLERYFDRKLLFISMRTDRFTDRLLFKTFTVQDSTDRLTWVHFT